MALQHPADRGGDERGWFERFAESASRFTSSPLFFVFCVGLVSLTLALHVADLGVKWLLLAGDAMTAVTLLLLALLKNSNCGRSVPSSANWTPSPRRCWKRRKARPERRTRISGR